MDRASVLPDRLPADSERLVEVLDRAFPARCARPGESHEEALFYGGKRDLIEILKMRFGGGLE